MSASGELILIVDDAPANLDLLTQTLEPRGYRILVAPDSQTAIVVASRAKPDLILLDVMLPDCDGYETCRRIHAHEDLRETPVLFISARNETNSLLEAFRAGGIDYITKPIDPEEVIIRIETHLKVSRLAKEIRQKNAELTQTVEQLRIESDRRQEAETALRVADEQLSTISAQEAERWGLNAFVGNSATLNKILNDIRRLQNFSTVNVLITGESGTGKELVARAVHFGSPRAKGPFVPVNCVAIPSELAESMFFGHTRGAFTGATVDRKGLFESAHGGTLFLDEIGDMPPLLQAKLLRVLEDGCITSLGSTRERKVDVRIVAATNADLHSQIHAGTFRRDLYFRLAQFPVDLPPLRERSEDIALLAKHFLQLFATEMGIATPPLEPAAIKLLTNHPFPGNVRELKNVIERALIESSGEPVNGRHIHLGTTCFAAPVQQRPVAAATYDDKSSGELPLNLEAAENMLIKRALAITQGNIAEAARKLGINRTRIYRKLGERGSLSLDSPTTHNSTAAVTSQPSTGCTS